MQVLELTLPGAATNLALDEALLIEAEESDSPKEVLRLWEPNEPMVVVGSSSRVAVEVDEQRAEQLGIPVYRRPSGGLSIVTGPGCLMYSLVLSYELRPELRSLDYAHQFVLGRIAEALRPSVPGVERSGTSDLTTGMRKFSGNSVRCKRRALLYHGTLLYSFPLELISACLKHPPRQPDYRGGREHNTFVTNLSVTRDELLATLKRAFGAVEIREDWPEEETERLTREKYSRREWNYRS